MKFSGLLTILTIIVIAKACPNVDSNCLRCYGNYCLVCVGGYSNQNGQCVLATVAISGCITYSSDKVCSQCQYGKSPSANGSTCNPISITNCLTTDAGNNCTACNGTMYPVGNLCTSENKCNIDNCAVCQYKYDRQVCLNCLPGFSVYTFNNYYTTCLAQYPAITNCRLTDYQDTTKCRECNLGYFFNNGQCSLSSSQVGLSYALSATKMSVMALASMFLMISKLW